jgi:dihydrolipoamide dehydrogenase
MRVALAETRDLGGTCLNRGCIPTKTLLQTAHLYRTIRNADSFGITASACAVDLEKLYARKDEISGKLRDGIAALCKANANTVFAGSGRINSRGSVTITAETGETELAATNILIATGSVPALPPIPGNKLPGVLCSDDLLAAPDEFDSLTVIGGGVIGVEFAEVFSSLGRTVTIVEAADRILPNMDREIAQNLTMILKRRGVEIHTGAGVSEIVTDNGQLACRFTKSGEDTAVVSDRILIATGRRPNVSGVLPEDFSGDLARGIPVDDRYMTEMQNVYAAGDVRLGTSGLAHAAAAEAIAAVSIMAGKKARVSDLSAVPGCIYTDPEIATIGITEAEAKERGIAVKTAKYLMGANARTMIEQGERGFIKLVFDADNGRLLGASLMCARATDLVSEIALALAHGHTADDLLRTMRPHPTFSEGITEAAEGIFGEAIHSIARR